MTAFGLSHIVSEVNNLNFSISTLQKINYFVEYELNQEVQEQKQAVLEHKPYYVDLVYLRNNKFPYIGIELIKHSISSSTFILS